jgi:ADP-ribose pyrophosphatase
MRSLKEIEVVEDLTQGSRCDEGFLRLRRLKVRNRYEDGSTSEVYPVDLVSRRNEDAVAIVLYEVGADRRPRVALRTGVRPPVWLRREKGLPQPAGREHLLMAEIVAGILEDGDEGPDGVARRAAMESHEEAGLWIPAGAAVPLGGPLFPSPGVSDELVHFACAEVVLDEDAKPEGDGSPMEEAGGVVVLPLDEALRACRSGESPDMKTEIALTRLCDALGYLPLLGTFVSDLPEEWRPDPERVAWILGEEEEEPE